MDGQGVSAWTPRALGEYLAARDPAADALVTPTARLAYGELLERAMHAAGGLHALGIRHGDHVGLLMGNDEHWLATFYGAALLGAVTVPLNTRFKAAELEYCLRKADCTALVYAPRFLNQDYEAMLGEIRPRLPLLAHAVRAGELPAGPMPPGGPAPEDLLLIQFTSGTTAFPKGAMLTHDSMLRNAFAAGERIGVRPEDRYFNCRPLFHVGGSTLSALACLVHGACLVTLPAFEAGAALEMMEKERCTITSGNDTIFQMLMGHPDFAKHRLSLRGGWAAAGPQTMRRIVDELGARQICAAYGLSEASPNVVMSDWREPEDLRVQGLPTPLPELHLRTVDGEIQVRGWSVMRGYYDDPEATALAFTEDGFLRTGDLGVAAARRAAEVGRAQEGRVSRRRRERRARRGGGGAARAPRGGERAGGRRARCAARRGAVRLRDAARRAAGHGGCAHRLGEGSLRELPRAALPEDRRQFRVHRHDRERQGAKGQAARARHQGVQPVREQR
jgi:fatty-acyl-CoA synthase